MKKIHKHINQGQKRKSIFMKEKLLLINHLKIKIHRIYLLTSENHIDLLYH